MAHYKIKQLNFIQDPTDPQYFFVDCEIPYFVMYVSFNTTTVWNGAFLRSAGRILSPNWFESHISHRSQLGAFQAFGHQAISQIDESSWNQGRTRYRLTFTGAPSPTLHPVPIAILRYQ